MWAPVIPKRYACIVPPFPMPNAPIPRYRWGRQYAVHRRPRPDMWAPVIPKRYACIVPHSPFPLLHPAMPLNGKTLFITGASRGIGLAIAVRAARDGANVAIAAKSDVPNPKLPGTIHSAAQAVDAAGGRGLALKCDIREEDQVRAAVAATVD